MTLDIKVFRLPLKALLLIILQHYIIMCTLLMMF